MLRTFFNKKACYLSGNIRHGVTILETHNMILRIFYIIQTLCCASENMKCNGVFMVFIVH